MGGKRGSISRTQRTHKNGSQTSPVCRLRLQVRDLRFPQRSLKLPTICVLYPNVDHTDLQWIPPNTGSRSIQVSYPSPSHENHKLTESPLQGYPRSDTFIPFSFISCLKTTLIYSPDTFRKHSVLTMVIVSFFGCVPSPILAVHLIYLFVCLNKLHMMVSMFFHIHSLFIYYLLWMNQ